MSPLCIAILSKIHLCNTKLLKLIWFWKSYSADFEKIQKFHWGISSKYAKLKLHLLENDSKKFLKLIKVVLEKTMTDKFKNLPFLLPLSTVKTADQSYILKESKVKMKCV